MRLCSNGYFTLELTQEEIKCEHFFTSNISLPTYTIKGTAAFESLSNTNVIKAV